MDVCAPSICIAPEGRGAESTESLIYDSMKICALIECRTKDKVIRGLESAADFLSKRPINVGIVSKIEEDDLQGCANSVSAGKSENIGLHHDVFCFEVGASFRIGTVDEPRKNISMFRFLSFSRGAFNWSLNCYPFHCIFVSDGNEHANFMEHIRQEPSSKITPASNTFMKQERVLKAEAIAP